jgi:hypothetical protein
MAYCDTMTRATCIMKGMLTFHFGFRQNRIHKMFSFNGKTKRVQLAQRLQTAPAMNALLRTFSLLCHVSLPLLNCELSACAVLLGVLCHRGQTREADRALSRLRS